MGRKAAGGAAYVGVAQVARIVITILSTIVVARILTPRGYGIVAMPAPIVAFILTVQDLGLSQATVQARTIEHAQSNALFWLNVFASGAIMPVLLALAPLIAGFYSEPKAGYFVAASAPTVVLGGTAIQHMALLNRELRFRAISVINIASAVVNFLATLVAAILLRSFWALWIGTACGSVVTVLPVWRASSWRPRLSIRFRGMD